MSFIVTVWAGIKDGIEKLGGKDRVAPPLSFGSGISKTAIL